MQVCIGAELREWLENLEPCDSVIATSKDGQILLIKMRLCVNQS